MKWLRISQACGNYFLVDKRSSLFAFDGPVCIASLPETARIARTSSCMSSSVTLKNIKHNIIAEGALARLEVAVFLDYVAHPRERHNEITSAFPDVASLAPLIGRARI